MKHKLEPDVSNDIQIKKAKPETNVAEQIKSLKQELKEEDSVLTALEEFLKIISSEGSLEFVEEYLRISPDCNDLFTPAITDKKTPRKLTLLWKILEKILNILSERNDTTDDTSVHLSNAGHSIACNILYNHLNVLYASFRQESKTTTSALKCMASMLSQGIQTVREFIKCFEFDTCFSQLRECAKIKQKHKEDARSCFVRFYLAFLVFGDVIVIKKLLEQKGLSSLLMGELHRDKVENILIILETIYDKLVNEFNLLKTTKLSFFTQTVLSRLVFLMKHNDESIKTQATRLIMMLCTNQNYGICFQSKDCFLTGKLVNPVLLRFLTSVKQSAMIREDIRDLTIETLCACPDAIVPYMNSLNLGLDPRLSDFWCTRLTFLINLWEGIPNIKDICKSQSSEVIPSKFQNKDLIMKLAIPHNITRHLFTQGLKNKVNHVKKTTLQLLEVSLTRCVELKNMLEENLNAGENNSNKSELTQWVDSIICMLPDVTPVIGIRQMAALTIDKLEQNSSHMETDDTEAETLNDEGTEQHKVSYDPIEMDILLDLSIKCLNLYQILKPGTLTLSGFNICKLLIFTKPVTEDIMGRSLQILLNEAVGGVSMWLKKKLSGPDNIFHIILNVILSWKKNEEIIGNSKRLFFIILNNMGQFNNYAFEIESWITHFTLSADASSIDVKVLVEEFAGACIDTVNKPFMYLENISSVFKSHESLNNGFAMGEFKLPSPLFFAVLRNMTSETVIKHMIIPVMKELVITNESPVLFMKILLQEIRDDCLGFYDEFLCYSYQWMQRLGLDVSFIDMNQFKDQELQHMHEEDSSIINKIAFELLQLKHGDNDPDIIESFLNKIKSMKEIIILFCQKCPLPSVYAITVFLTNVIRFLYNSMTLTSCNILVTLFDMIESSMRIILTRNIDAKSSNRFIIDLFSLPLFKEILNIQGEWKAFCQNIYMIFLECCSEFKSMDLLKGCVDDLIHTIVSKSDVKVSEAIEVFCKFAVYLDKEMLRKNAENMAISLLSCKEQLCDEYLINFLHVLKMFKQIGLDMDQVTSKLESCDVNNFLDMCIVSQRNLMMDVFLNIISLLQFDGDIQLKHKEYQELLKLDKSFVNCAVFMSQRNVQIVKIDDCSAGTLVYFNQEFIHDVKNGNVPSSILITNLLPLLLNVFKINSGHADHSEFVSMLKSLLWKDIIEGIGSQSNVVRLLTLFVSHMSDDEKVECLCKMKFLLKPESSAEDVETGFIFCTKALSLLTDGKMQKLCLLELIVAVIETITNRHLAEDLYIIFINNLLCLVQIMTKFETKLKSVHYASLCSIWMKLVKKILKSKYTDHLSMSALLKCINIFYVNKQFIKKCSLTSKDLYQMVVSHSKFFEIMFTEDESMVTNKLGLIRIISSLLELSNVYMPALIPMLLVAYETKLSQKDCCILSILNKFEKNEVSLSQFYPFVWGNNALSTYKEKDVKSSLFKEQSSAQVLENIDKQKMMKSALEFPIHLSFENHQEVKLCKENYDPLFFLPLFASLLQPECVVDCYHFMESGCLSFTFAAMSSFELRIRKLAYCILTLYNDHLESARIREKSQLTYLLMLLKHSVTEEYTRFPSIWTSCFIQYINFVLKPDQHLYTVLSNVILQKPIINLKELPVFLSLFNSYNVENVIERVFLLKLLGDGLKGLTDYYLYKKYHVFELLIAFYDTQICDKNMKLLIHDVFVAACSHSTAVFDLVKTNSILSWIHTSVVDRSSTSKSCFYNLLYTIKNTFQEGSDKSSGTKQTNVIPKLLLHEMLLICEHGLRNISSVDYKDRVRICCVYSWIQSTTNYFGDMYIWQQDDIQFLYFDVITNLLLNTQSKDDEDGISKIFCNIVLTMLEKDVTLLEGKCWRKIYCLAKERKMDNVIKLFEKLMHWCSENRNKTLHVKIMNVIE